MGGGGGAGSFALGVLSQLLTVLRLWYQVSSRSSYVIIRVLSASRRVSWRFALNPPHKGSTPSVATQHCPGLAVNLPRIKGDLITTTVRRETFTWRLRQAQTIATTSGWRCSAGLAKGQAQRVSGVGAPGEG